MQRDGGAFTSRASEKERKKEGEDATTRFARVFETRGTKTSRRCRRPRDKGLSPSRAQCPRQRRLQII